MDERDSEEALHTLERWNWQRPHNVEAEYFFRIVGKCWPIFSNADVRTEEWTLTTLHSLYERANLRLGTFLPNLRGRLRKADDTQEQVLLEQAVNWSENRYELLVIDAFVEGENKIRAFGLDDERLSIDDLIRRTATARWQKVAMVVGSIMTVRRGLIDEAIAERVRALVDSGTLEAQGDLASMRSSEIRLAQT